MVTRAVMHTALSLVAGTHLEVIQFLVIQESIIILVTDLKEKIRQLNVIIRYRYRQ